MGLKKDMSLKILQEKKDWLWRLFHRFSFLNQSPKEFLKNQNRYSELLKKYTNKAQLTKTEIDELNRAERQIRQDIKTFRGRLSKLGLPGYTLHEFLLRFLSGWFKGQAVKNCSIREPCHYIH